MAVPSMPREHFDHTRDRYARQGRTHKLLGHTVGVPRAKRRVNDLDPVGLKHFVNTVGKFLARITNQEAAPRYLRTSDFTL